MCSHRDASRTRRSVLFDAAVAFGAAVVAGGAAMPGCAAPRGGRGAGRDGYIDAHSHVRSPDVARFPLGPWITKTEMSPASFTAEELLAVAEPAGVDRVVLIQHAPYYGDDNSYLIDCAR